MVTAVVVMVTAVVFPKGSSHTIEAAMYIKLYDRVQIS